MMVLARNPQLKPCDDAGGAIVAHGLGTDAIVPIWHQGQWQPGDLVREEVPPGSGNWVMYLAVNQTGTLDPTPSTGGANWVALTPIPTAIPPWRAGETYPAGSPVRIDTGAGLMRVFVSNGQITNSQNSPDTAAGITDGWHEVAVKAPPSIPPFDPTLAYRVGDSVMTSQGRVFIATTPIAPSTDVPGTANASVNWLEVAAGALVTVRTIARGPQSVPQPNDPPNPNEGDQFVNTATGVTWVHHQPAGPGAAGVWVRGQIVWHTSSQMQQIPVGQKHTSADFDPGATTHPDPSYVELQDGDVIMVGNGQTGALQGVLYVGQ